MKEGTSGSRRIVAKMPDGRPIEAISLARGAVSAEILTIGATLRMLRVPGRVGKSENVMLGYADIADYAAHPLYLGAVVGRFANRIAGGRFTLDGTDYALPINNAPNTLHGGPHGFDTALWQVAAVNAESATLTLDSPAGPFPGNLHVTARYRLADDGIAIELCATTDAPTIVNLTHHAYFNLAGEACAPPIDDHWLQIAATRYTPVDSALIPTGEIVTVAGTPFDFRAPHRIGERIGADDPQIAIGSGYDHNFVRDASDGALTRAATLYDPGSGRTLDLFSTAPGLQFYSGNYLGDAPPSTSGRAYGRRTGVCLEPQLFPDAPNQPGFPSARLDPGETYRHTIAFRFRVADTVDTAFPR